MKKHKTTEIINSSELQTDNIVKADFTPPQPKQADIIKSINYDQKAMIADILKLYSPSGIELDCTYSKGSFYKNAPYSEPEYKSDLAPLFDDVMEADAENLPFYDDFLKSIMFDPPFLVGQNKAEPTGIMRKRFSGFRYIKDLWEFYRGALKEIHRVLEPNGILIFKCQDTVNGSTNYLSHAYIINEAEKLGFYTKDLFVLLAKSRLIGHNHKIQKHARKFHSYFLVFVKKDKPCTPIHTPV